MRLRQTAVAAALALASSAVTAVAAAPPRSVALLPLAAHVTDLPYAPLPSPHELDALTATLGHDLRAEHVVLIDPAAVARAVRRAGFDQHDTYRACADERCAQRIGALLGARSVIVGSTTREMAMIWATDAQIVDVPSGRAEPIVQAGYKGDFTTMQVGLSELAGALAQRLSAIR